MKHEEGAVEFGAVIILFFLSAFLSAAVLFVQGIFKYYDRNLLRQKEYEAANQLLIEIAGDFQALKDELYDHENNYILQSIKNKYSACRLDLKDVSSGYHLDFLSDEDLADHELVSFLFINGSASPFAALRNSRGLSTTFEPYRELINPAALDACTSYGWVSNKKTNSFAFRTIKNSFNANENIELFPLVNSFPLINVNMVSPDILAPLMKRRSFNIRNPSEKIEKLKNRSLFGPFLLSDISSALEIPLSHDLFAYLGTKTAFWKITFQTPQGLTVEAVIAAIPDPDGNPQDVAHYALIDRNISYEY
jgi:hypothetical protein